MDSFEWGYTHAFKDKEEFRAEFPQIKDSRDHFIPTQLFDHGNSPGDFPKVEDNPDIWIVATTFAKYIDWYHYMAYDGKPDEQMITDILNYISLRRMETHV